MSDCISRAALIARFDKVDMDNTPYCQAIQHGIEIAKDWAMEAPAVKPDIPCHCADCRHLEVFNDPDLYASCRLLHLLFEPFKDDTRECFCSWGERKEDGADHG